MILKLKRTPGVYLVGFMASGKTTIGRLLADELGWAFADLDEDIVDHFGSEADKYGGKVDYQTLINVALREYVESRSPKFEETLRRIIREELRGRLEYHDSADGFVHFMGLERHGTILRERPRDGRRAPALGGWCQAFCASGGFPSIRRNFMIRSIENPSNTPRFRSETFG